MVGIPHITERPRHGDWLLLDSRTGTVTREKKTSRYEERCGLTPPLLRHVLTRFPAVRPPTSAVHLVPGSRPTVRS